MQLGVIADDFTGASDIALMLSRGGLHVLQHIGVPQTGDSWGDADAVVVSLKSRTNPVGEAVAMSLATLERLRVAGARQIFFKYCSTFDSTDQGNIGPVAEALREALGAKIVPFCPAFPSNGRTIYKGHLFVGDVLLSDSPMKDHPLTPMRDANLVRVLQRQSRAKVGLVPVTVVEQGAAAIRAAFEAAAAAGTPFVVVDALNDAHLTAIGHAAAGLPLITGGSGVAIGLPDNLRAAGNVRGKGGANPWHAPKGARAILAGSCSAATRNQVKLAQEAGLETRRIDPLQLADPVATAGELAAWAKPRLGEKPVLIYSSAVPEEIRAAQEKLGGRIAGARVEQCLAETARLLVAAGVAQMVVAGGETSGAVVEALGIKTLGIGPEIDPGVPWMGCAEPVPLVLALKSGNFGATDFFLKAWGKL